MKTFFAYVEDNKSKVIDITKDQNYRDMARLCSEVGLPVLGCILDTNEVNARNYAEVVLRGD